jgi:hypothetical protein
MPTIANITLDDAHTTVKEKLEEIGGRFERRITLAGVTANKSSLTAIDAELDALLDAVSAENFTAELSLRPGRRLFVRRESFHREVNGDRLIGAFEMGLLAEKPFEEAVSEENVAWNITESGAILVIAPGGNAPTDAVIAITAEGNLVNLSVSDGERDIVYEGIVPDGETLIIDGVERKVTLLGENVTPYTRGVFPQLHPDNTTLAYTDDATSSHTANAAVAYRARWW